MEFILFEKLRLQCRSKCKTLDSFLIKPPTTLVTLYSYTTVISAKLDVNALEESTAERKPQWKTFNKECFSEM